MEDKDKNKKIKGVQIKDTIRVSWRTLKLVWSVDHWLFLGTFITTLIPGVVPFVNLYIYKLVIDMVIKQIATGFDPATFYPLLGLRVLTYFGQSAAYRTQSYLERLLFLKVPVELDHIFLEKLSSLDIHYFENDKFRDLLEKAKESYKFRPQQLVDNIFYSFQTATQFLIAFVAISRLNWYFIVLIAAVSIPEFINQSYQKKLSWGIWGQNSPFRKRYNYLTHLLEGHREIKEVKIFRLAKNLLGEIKEIQQKFYGENKKLATKQYSTNLVFNFLSTAVFVGIEIFVIFETIGKRLTVGDISFYTGVVNNFQNGLEGLLSSLNNVYDNCLYLKSMFEVLDAEPIVKISEHPVKIDEHKNPVVEFKNVSFAYPESKKKILDNFSITINPGEKIAFVGENGAGKSTIIKLLARFYDVDSGEILLDGVNIKDLDLDNWYRHIGVLFQDFNRYEHTVKENIYFGKVHEELKMEEIIEAATSAGAHSVIQKFDKKYEQILGKIFEGGIELSGGQWQKVALARAFFRNAPILILDEPTASIDARAEAEIFNKVEKLSKNKTVIIISHRFSTVRNADKIYVIDKGCIVESGSHEALTKQDGQYAELFKLQAKGYQ